MALTRTAPYGTATDDSGGGTDGTIINNAWLQGMLDLVDARWSRTTVTSTGTQTVIDPSNADVVLFNNASLLTIRSITAPASPAKPGKRLTLMSIGAGNVVLNHQDTTGTTAANRLVNRATSAGTPLAAGYGVATYIYDDVNSRWRLCFHDQGAAITPTFAAGDYTANGSMTWTLASGDVTAQSYYLVGKRMYVDFQLATTTVGGTPNNELRVGNGAWGGFTSSRSSWNRAAYFVDNGVGGSGILLAGSGATYIAVYRYDTANYTASTNATYVYGQINFEVT